MRILIAVHGFPPTHAAGAELRSERMARWLTDHGHYVEVFTIERLDSPGFEMKSAMQGDIMVHRLFYSVKDGDAFRNLYDYPRVGEAFREVAANKQFDLVHIVSGYLLAKPVVEVSRELSIPTVITLTEYWFMCARLNLITATNEVCSGPDRPEKCARCIMEHKRRYRLPSATSPKLIMDMFWSFFEQTPLVSYTTLAVSERQETLRNILNSVDIVICPSQALIDKFAEYGFNTERYLYIRQGLATPELDNFEYSPKANDTLRLGFSGQIKPHKGVDLIVDAAISLLDAGEKITLDLWGAEAPGYMSTLKKRTANYPQIRWNGRYPGEKVWDVLGNMDVLVMPSRWYENSPNSILEAYAMRVPAIVTDLGGMAELVEHEKSGLVFELNNVADLRQQIQRLINDPGLLEHLRSNIPPVKTIHQEMEEILWQYERCLNKTS